MRNRQKDIPANEALRDAVKQITSGESLAEMLQITERVYLAAKESKSTSRNAKVGAFINFVLRGYLQNPKVEPANAHFAEEYSSELLTVKHRLRQLGVIPPKS